MDLEQLAVRVQRLEDLEAIKQLKALYCEICDDDHDPERIVTIFTHDCVWEGRGIGRAEGHAELKKLFGRFRDMMSFSQHMTMNPRITVHDDDTAEGTWYFLGPFTFRDADAPDGKQAKWQAARYHERYAKVDGVWKIRSLRVRGPAFSADYDKGWGQ